ncbi:MAG: SDR family oxidoreductase [Myxococcota bacterium]
MITPLSNFLVLGGSGKIGTNIAGSLNLIGETHCPTRRSIDLSNTGQLTKALDWEQFDAVFYCAGICGRQINTFEHAKSQAVNVLSPALIAHLGLKYKFRFCYISSDDVFDGHLGRPYHEFDDTNPLNRYGKEKRLAEIKILEKNPDAVIARLPMVYGGTYHKKSQEQFLDKFIDAARSSQGKWTLSNSCVTNPSALDDILPVLFELTLNTHEAGIFHLFNAEEASLYEFAAETLKILNSTLPIFSTDSTFSTDDYQRKAFAPLQTLRLPPLRSWRQALEAHLSKTMN